VSLAPSSPTTDQALTATATKADADGDDVSLTFTWTVNGTLKRSFTSATALSDALDLSVAGNGDPGDVVRVEVVPNDGTASGAMAADQVTVGGGPTIYANDVFSRTVTNAWGTATAGGSYTLLGTAADYDVAAGVGTIVLPAAGANRSAALAGVSAANVDLTFRVATNKLSTGGGQFIYGVVRRVSATAEYRAKLRIAADGSIFLQAGSVAGNTETPLGTEIRVPGLLVTAGAFIHLRVQVSGANPTTIRMRAWADGSAEPASWQYTVTSSAAGLQVAGAVGVRAYVSGAVTNTPITLSVDDFRATSIP